CKCDWSSDVCSSDLDEPQLLDYSRAILNELRSHQVRAEIDTSTDKINGKIQRAKQMKVRTMFVFGKRDMEANAISLRVHGKGNLGAKPRNEVIADVLAAIKERRACGSGPALRGGAFHSLH